MKPLLISLALLLLTGCAGMEPSPYPNFWTQCVKADAWGVSMISPYGPINMGRITWERNVACDVDQTKPELPLSSILTPKPQPPVVGPVVK
jgi:hypothetical protein